VAILSPDGRYAPPPWADDAPARRDIDRRLDPDHLARSIERAVARLDLAAFVAGYGRTGSSPHRPDLLLRAVLYAARRGRHRPAEWDRDARESDPVRWLLRGCRPARSVWYAFRDRIAPFVDDWNRQVLARAVAADLTPATRAALDGTAVAANASRRRMADEEKLRLRAEQLDRAVAADTRGAAPEPRPAWMAPTPAGRVRQRRALGRARERMDQLQRRNAGKRASKRQARDKVVVSPSDPEAAVGKDKEGVYRPLYNVQVADDLDSPFVLGYQVFAQPNDAGLLGPMAARLEELLGRPVEELLADSAYAGGPDLAAAAAAGVTLYAPAPAAGGGDPKQIPKGEFRWLPEEQTYECPRGRRLEYEGSSRQKRSGPEAVRLHRYRCPPEHCRACPLRERCTPNPEQGRTVSRGEHEELIEALRARMGAAEAKARYRLRRQTVELVNADWKAHRGLRRFSGRGLVRVRCQVGVLVLAHNLLTLLVEEKKPRAETAAAVGSQKIPA